MKSGGLRTTVSSAVTKYKGCVYVILHRTRGGKLTSYERNTEIERERKNKEERNTFKNNKKAHTKRSFFNILFFYFFFLLKEGWL